MRLPKRIEPPRIKERPREEKVRCVDCIHCKPITGKPNLDYKGEPFLCTCDKQPWEMMMDREHECQFFEV
jgi:hypothetical protein